LRYVNAWMPGQLAEQVEVWKGQVSALSAAIMSAKPSNCGAPPTTSADGEVEVSGGSSQAARAEAAAHAMFHRVSPNQTCPSTARWWRGWAA
jgi:hypothetical protein